MVSFRGPLEMSRNLSYHGVLAHQDNTITTESVSDLVHLLGADIVDGDDEDALVLPEKGISR
jgi:hypothetical protein